MTRLLILQESARRCSEFLLEHPGEMLGILEPQPVGYFRDGFPFQEHLPGFFHQIMPDILRGAFSGTGADQVSEIIGREAKLSGAIADGGDALQILPSIGLVPLQDVIDFPAEIIGRGAGSLELPFIKTGCQFEQE